MTDREKLSELLDSKDCPVYFSNHDLPEMVEFLLANGVNIVEKPKPQKMLCIQWNPGHHGLSQRCEWRGKNKNCSCHGDFDKCDYPR